jgi:hypothetical protein
VVMQAVERTGCRHTVLGATRWVTVQEGMTGEHGGQGTLGGHCQRLGPGCEETNTESKNEKDREA